MRIDYSEPKKSCSAPLASHNRPRKESSGGTVIIVFITAIVCLGIGFGSGWMLSQRSAKKSFKAAMEQQSLENSPQPPKTLPAAQQQQTAAAPAPPVSATTQQPQGGVAAQTPAGNDATQPAADPPLSFYKTLPSGQKGNALGSGINNKGDKTAKQPLQAVIPTNISRPAPPQNDEKPAAPAQAKPGAVPRPDAAGLTVQVASFSLKSEAETLRSKLASKGYNVNISESRLGDKGTWYRVRVGKNLGPDAAKELAGKLGKGAIAIPDKD